MLPGWLGLFGVGLALGWLGAGGTALALPVLVYAIGMGAHEAVATSLVLVGGASVAGAAMHARRGVVRWRTAAACAPLGLAGAALGARWSYLLSGRALLLTFAGLVLVIGVRMWREHAVQPGGSARWGWMSAAAFSIGTLTGLLGNGGGFLMVPALAVFGGLALREAMATSLVLIALNCSVAFAGHLPHQKVSGLPLSGMLAVTVAGMWVGVELSHRTEAGKLRRGFAALLIGMAVLLIWRNY